MEHTPDPQLPVYEGNLFIFVFWGTWGLFQGSVGIFFAKWASMSYKWSYGGPYLGVEPKIRGKTPKMDGLFHGKPYEQMDDLGVPLFLETSTWVTGFFFTPINGVTGAPYL